MKVETNAGIYNIRKPVGRIGAVHFTIMSSAAPRTIGEEDVDGNPIMSEADIERANEAFAKWTIQVLPNIIIDGPYTYEEMPGSDQYAIFLASGEDMGGDIGEELFRIVE